MNADLKIIGIDLGTTNSVVSIIEGDEPIVIPNQEGTNKTPSVVAFLDNNDCIVGEIARRQAATNPMRTISSIKRLMGRHYEDVEEWADHFPFQIVNHDDRLLIDVNGYGYGPEQISALILKKLREAASSYLGQEVKQAVITVPAHFDDNQRNATMEAARLAGLDVLRLLNEPTAAALAYGMGRSSEVDELIAVYDFGGGTFDISVLEISGKTFEVRTSTGDSHLGGDDLDNAIVGLLVDEFEEEHGVDLRQDPVTLRRLKEVAEKAKCELSTASQALITLPFISYKGQTPLHLERRLTRGEFEELIEGFVQRTIKCCRRALEDAGISKKEIKKVILVGGSTRIPLVQDHVEEFFGLAPFKGINPDEVVAMGAATQAAIFSGNIEEVMLLDVAPHSLGIEVKDGKFSRIIDKNATIPIKAAKNFTTTEDNQSYVIVHILQGEAEDAADNRSLGKFSLTGIPPQPRGRPRIRVTFFMNADGVMEISAEELGSGIAKSLTIVHSDLDENERKTRKRARQRRTRSSGGVGRAGSSATREGPERRYAADATGQPQQLAKRKGVPPQTSPQAPPAGEVVPGGASMLSDTNPGQLPTAPVGGLRSSSSEAIPISGLNALPAVTPLPLAGNAAPPRLPSVPPAPPRLAPPAAAPTQPAPPSLPSVPPVLPPPPMAYPTGAMADLSSMPTTLNSLTPLPGIAPPADPSGSGTGAPVMYGRAPSQPPGPPPAFSRAATQPMQGAAPQQPPQPATPPPPPSATGSAARPIVPNPAVPPAFPSTPTPEPAPAQRSAMESATVYIPSGPAPDFPQEVLDAIALSDAGDDGGPAIEAYRTALSLLARSPWDADPRWEVVHARACLLIGAGEADASREAIQNILTYHGSARAKEVLPLTEHALTRFSSSSASFRRLRGRVRELLDDLEGACEDLEFAAKSEPMEGDGSHLESLYRQRIQRNEDPAAQFKLVKVFLKTNRVDEAIEILQELQHQEAYETRAIKILGLCHWQKNLHFLAWQKFKQLKQNEEIRDILYRLANDMEGTGQLNNALSVYEHIAAEGPEYRDVQARVKKLRYRIKMQQEENEANKVSTVLNDPRFTVIEEINRGSMGIIYKAKDKTLDEVVALKVLNDYLGADPAAVERFKREARAAKRLSHPYIVRIHDMFEAANKKFISMEYIDGTDLKRLLSERTQFSEEQLIYYFLQIADALAYAHRLNVIHRDIKPANIMITRSNHVKVTDFGIAKILKGDDSTKSGTAVIGTPLYMAPEQITGEGVDQRSDIYSLGIMMYELTSGHPPFYLGNIEYHHIHTAPPPLPERVSPKLRQIIMKCVEKSPINRFQSVEEIIAALNQPG